MAKDQGFEDVVYPISEMFVSPQGEGRNTGMLMQFIRFGGCTVGKPFSQAEREQHDFPIYTERCTIYDGRTFPCDTDYRVKERKSVRDILKWCMSHNVKTVLFTGGEPLMRDLTPLMRVLHGEGFDLHVETSGTIKPDLNQLFWKLFKWICVSPKYGFQWEYADLNIAHEFKLLVDDNFEWNKVPVCIRKRQSKISLSPVNDEKELNYDNMQKCIEIQKLNPDIRITTQMQKIWKVR